MPFQTSFGTLYEKVITFDYISLKEE
ncbi:hypothetical protein SAMN05421503_1889 [Terribacillus aidingensis]|uniref:Uncharacterized protein n=1 Tax=Terribacillus aidingensis TaxID=586416 RepID=A0A285NMX3_9BACI|nr:hypothetical protein SAMN05421503_1889 [Terribacillus aidingensis]